MTIVAPDPTEATLAPAGEPSLLTSPPDLPPAELPSPPSTAAPSPGSDEANPTIVGASAALSAAAAAVLVGGLFIGPLATMIGLAAVAVGAGLVTLSYRLRRPALLQWFVVPVLAVFGSVAASLNAGTGSRDPFQLVISALRAGGISQPPVPFDPGWQILTVLLLGGLAAGTTMVAVSYGLPKLAVFAPAPVTFAVLVLQPPKGGQLRTAVALALLVLALVVIFGADSGQLGGASGGFQLRRIARGVAGLACLLGLVAGITQLDFLFPPVKQTQVVPPQKPKPPPPEPDRDLFDVASPMVLAWRLGTLDGYDGHDWLTPPFDRSKLQDVPKDGLIPGATRPPATVRTVTVTFTLRGVHDRVLPSVLGAFAIHRTDGTAINIDPRTQVLRLTEALPHNGETYTIEAIAPPSGDTLRKAPAPPPSMNEFLKVPPAPAEVQAILDKAPQGPMYDRLQYVRAAYYRTLVAAGPGKPKSMPPSRVVELLHSKPASPFEITAAEVLLARWAGIPARFGYGYYDGDKIGTNLRAVHPRHASTWLEVYFSGSGWVPLLGTPPRAQGTLNTTKNPNPTVRPAEDLALTVYVPVQQPTLRLFYTLARYWAIRVLPWVLGVALVLWAYPALLKVLRRNRRQRWAAARGPRERIAVAYLEYRDLAFDLNIGSHALTPLEFVSLVEPDDDHLELAWLVTRALWGDLQRDLRDADVVIAQEAAVSLRRRLRGAQPMFNRVLAAVSRVSLKQPNSREIPNLWWPPRPKLRLPRLRVPTLRPAAATSLLVALLLLSGCAQSVPLTSDTRSAMPAHVVPDNVNGLTFHRQLRAEQAYAHAGPDALVDSGQVFTVSDGANVEASVQIAPFKRSLLSAGRQRELKDQVLASVGGNLTLKRVGDVTYRVLSTGTRKVLVYLPADMSYMLLVVARPSFDRAEQLLGALVDYQRGTTSNPDKQVAQLPDPLRGIT